MITRPASRFHRLATIPIVLFFFWLASTFITNINTEQEIAFESSVIHEPLAALAMRKYLETGGDGGSDPNISPLLEHQQRMTKVLRSVARSSKNRMEAISGRWWVTRPPLCYSVGCPCTVSVPCFQRCDSTTGCPDVRGDIPVSNSISVFPNSMLAFSTRHRPHPTKRIRSSGPGESLAVKKSKLIVVLVDTSMTGLSDTPLQDLFHNEKHDEPGESLQATRAVEALRGIVEAFDDSASISDEMYIAAFDQRPPEESRFLQGPFTKGHARANTFLPFLRRETASSVFPSLRERTKSEGELREKESSRKAADIPQALQWAKDFLERHTLSGAAELHVILLSSGLTSCSMQAGAIEDPAHLRACPAAQTEILGQTFESEYDRQLASLTDLLSFSIPSYQSSKITLSAFLFGDAITPHELFFPSISAPALGCMKKDEMEERNYLDVMEDPWAVPSLDPNLRAFIAASKGSRLPYYQPNIFFSVGVRRTGGVCMALRPECAKNEIEDLQAAIDAACRQASTVPFFRDRQPKLIKSGHERDAAAFRIRIGEFVDAGLQDASGRVICDPARRSFFQQSFDVTKSLLSKDSLQIL